MRESVPAMSNREPAPFGALLLRYRATAHLTQEQLAAQSGLSVDAIAALERGKRRTPREATIKLLADALELDVAARVEFLAAARPTSMTTATDAEEDGAGARQSTRRWPLPPEPTPLVDRTSELETILQRLTAEGVRLLTLVGPAGVGKTRLALVAAQLADDSEHFPDGIVFADLSSVRDPNLVLTSLANVVGLIDVGGRPVLERLVDVFRDRKQLMVLDNVEQVLPATAPILAELLSACPGLTILATSRVPLHLRLEQTLRVPPLPIPDSTQPYPSLNEFVAIPSVTLFVQRAQAREVDFALSELQIPVVARLVTQLDGLPLALEMAAARTGTLSLPAIARRLGDRLRLLHWEAADAPERQRSLEAALGWSYDLLGEDERRLFRCLGVFAGRVSLDAIAAVDGAVVGENAEMAGRGNARQTLDGLLSLAEQSLILPARPAMSDWQEDEAEDENENPELGFHMLETVRTYAADLLAAGGELDTARWAHAQYFLALAERAAPLLRGSDQRAWFLRLEREHDNLRAALRWLLDQEDGAEREVGLRLAAALGFFWWRRGYHAEGRRWLAEALARAPEANPDVRLRALVAAGPGFALQGVVESAQAVLQEALALAEQRQNASATAEALAYLGLRAVLTGELAEATGLLREALRHWEALGDPYGLGLTFYFLGHLAVATGDAADADAYYRDALRWLGTSGDAHLAGFVHCYLGATDGARGERLEAVANVQAGLRVGVALHDRWLLGVGAHAAALFGAWVDPATGARLLGAADAMAQATGATLVWKQLPGRSDVAGLRERLAREGEGELAAPYRAGHSLRFGDAAALALTVLEDVARTLVQIEPGSGTAPEARHESKSLLSAREQEVLRLVAEGLSSKAIGQRLFLSPSTVNQHIKSIFNKLGADTRAQAVALAAQRGLL